jgi:hypothetical protein
VEVIAEWEMDKLAAKCARYESQGKPIPRWVWQGMEERYYRVEQIEHRVRMVLGVFGATGRCRWSANLPTRSVTCWYNTWMIWSRRPRRRAGCSRF